MEETGVKVQNAFVLHTRHQLKKKRKNPKNMSGSIALQMTGMLLKPTAHRHEPKTNGERGNGRNLKKKTRESDSIRATQRKREVCLHSAHSNSPDSDLIP